MVYISFEMQRSSFGFDHIVQKIVTSSPYGIFNLGMHVRAISQRYTNLGMLVLIYNRRSLTGSKHKLYNK